MGVTAESPEFWNLASPNSGKNLAWWGGDVHSADQKEVCPVDPAHPIGTSEAATPLKLLLCGGKQDDIVWSWHSDFCVQEHVLHAFQEQGFTGFRHEKVFETRFRNHPAKPAPALWKLRITGFGGLVSESTGIRLVSICTGCGRAYFSGFNDGALKIDSKTWDGSDFFFVWPMPNYVFVTERVVRFLKERKFKGFRLQRPEEMKSGSNRFHKSQYIPGRLSDSGVSREKAQSQGFPMDLYFDPPRESKNEANPVARGAHMRAATLLVEVRDAVAVLALLAQASEVERMVLGAVRIVQLREAVQSLEELDYGDALCVDARTVIGIIEAAMGPEGAALVEQLARLRESERQIREIANTKGYDYTGEVWRLLPVEEREGTEFDTPRQCEGIGGAYGGDTAAAGKALDNAISAVARIEKSLGARERDLAERMESIQGKKKRLEERLAKMVHDGGGGRAPDIQGEKGPVPRRGDLTADCHVTIPRPFGHASAPNNWLDCQHTSQAKVLEHRLRKIEGRMSTILAYAQRLA